ncbi:hypothetical protein M407DRAFT_22466 [Tulasnella calospora MUT 4182]|uniref:Myb-like domain-containing protein n=1 Tax=Tulasnella calospora MUT 4182 TaxID=1051891 RepID=A0A0C3QCI1_9AGAM|nr:hypothetical protein M407DRAFT_22466 [Tulasnella calospora MUT 4182]
MTVTTRSHTKVQDGSRGSSKSREREGERQPTNHTSSPPPSPPSAPINQEEEDLQIPWSRSPSQEQSNEAHSSTEESEDDEEPESVGHGRGRGWLPWQDRLLITEAKALRTFLAPHGSKSQAWEELAAVLKEKSLGKVTRSGPTCKARFSKLIKAHRANETRSLQATGKNEEIDEHVQSLTEIVQLLDDANLETERATESARMKIEMERRVGLEMRDAAMRNLVQANQLKEDLSELNSASVRERQGQRKRKSDAAGLDDPDSDKENQQKPTGPHKRRQTLKARVADVVEEFRKADGEILKQARQHDDQREQRAEERHKAVVDTLGQVGASLDRVADVLSEQRADRQLLLEVIGSTMPKRD